MRTRFLSDADRRILEFETAWAGRSVGKDRTIRTELALRPVNYYQRLHQILDSEAAVVAFPQLVKRLRRLREERRRLRHAGGIGRSA